MSDNETAANRWRTLLMEVEAAATGGALIHPVPQIIAVSKMQPMDKIEPLILAGQRVFGENRVQEAKEKWPGLQQRYPDIALHLIGPLQRNKVAEALRLFDVIETVDRESLVDALSKERAEKTLRCQAFFVQVNTGEEPQKGGASPQSAQTLITYARKQGLPVTGLMCIPPAHEPPAPHFALLRTMADDLGLVNVSMGMSADWRIAVRMGATHIRLGTALFGEREQA